jgi:hypothetical protein
MPQTRQNLAQRASIIKMFREGRGFIPSEKKSNSFLYRLRCFTRAGIRFSVSGEWATFRNCSPEKRCSLRPLPPQGLRELTSELVVWYYPPDCHVYRQSIHTKGFTLACAQRQ